MCSLLFYQMRARCPREPSVAGDFCCLPRWACLPRCSWAQAQTHTRGLACFCRPAKSLSPITDAGLNISLSVSVPKTRTEFQIFKTWVLANSTPVQSFCLFWMLVKYSRADTLIQGEETGKWRWYFLLRSSCSDLVTLLEVPLWKILLLKSHVTLEGQDRLTGIRVGRTMLVVIWRTEEEAWQWRGDFLLCARGRLGVIIVFLKNQEK